MENINEQNAARTWLPQWMPCLFVLSGGGAAGNSGKPALHIHAQKRETAIQPFSRNPLPARINGRFLVRDNRFGSP